MIWYRSVRAAAEHDRIIHYFQCGNCNRIEEKTTKIPSNGDGEAPPAASTRPRRGRNRALAAFRLADAALQFLGELDAHALRQTDLGDRPGPLQHLQP